jgi:hypothetical protein
VRSYVNSLNFTDGVSRQPDFRYIRVARKRICKMIVRKKSRIIPVAFLILISIVLGGCSKKPEPDVVKTGNVNQAPTASNNNSIPANNNVSANPPNTQAASNNTPTTIVNKDKKPLPPVKDPTPQISGGGGDFALFTEARAAISSDQELLNTVIIEIKEGNVTLTGSVSSAAQKTKAGQLVQSVKGIKSVKNNLRVAS